MTYQEWIDKVDAKLQSILGGLDHNDLPDKCWRDWYDDGTAPDEAVRQALAEEGWNDPMPF